MHKKVPASVSRDLNRTVSQALFDGHTLGEIARLVHVVPAEHGDVVGEQLQRHAGHDRHEHRDGLRDLDEVVRDFVERVAVLGRDGDDLATAGLDFTHVADDLVEEGVLRGDDHHRHVLVDKGNRAVLHFGGGIAFGVDVTDFLEFQGAFHGHRVVEVAAQVQEVVRVHVLVRDTRNLVRKLERLFHKLGQVLHRLHDVGARFKTEPALATQQKRNHGENGHLRGERLGARHADFRARMQVHAAIARAGDGRTHAVTDGKRGRSLLLGFLEGGQRVGGFARLANREDQRARLDDGVPVAELRSVFDFHGHAREVFDHVFADHAGIVARAASGDDDAVDVAEFPDVRVEARELRVAFGTEQAAAHGVAEHLGLFENFFQHEVGEPALRDGVCVEFHILHVALHFAAVQVHDGIAAAFYLDDVIVVEVHDLLRVVDDCGNIAREEEFRVVPDTEDERGSAAGADERVGFVATDDTETEGPFNQSESLENRLLEVALVVAGDKVGYHFGISLGLELDAFRGELCLEARVVLDNAVVDNGNLAVEAGVRVCILFGRCTVGGPAGVGDADIAFNRVVLELLFEGADLARCADRFDLAAVDKGDARAIVATVFEFLESADQDGERFVLADVADYSAHSKILKPCKKRERSRRENLRKTACLA